MYNIFFLNFFVFKVVTLVGGGSVINGAYPAHFPKANSIAQSKCSGYNFCAEKCVKNLIKNIYKKKLG